MAGAREGLEAHLKYLGDVPSFSVKAMITVMAERALGAACLRDSAAMLSCGQASSTRSAWALMDLAFDMGLRHQLAREMVVS